MRKLIATQSSLALVIGLTATSFHGCSSNPAPSGSDPSDASCVPVTIVDSSATSPDAPTTHLTTDAEAATPKDDPFFTVAKAMLEDGRRTFRSETFGDEAFWGDTLQLHKAIEGAALGGVGPGLSPKAALAAGLKVDAEMLPPSLVAMIQAGKVDLDAPATTIALLKLDAVIGVTGKFDAKGSMTGIGIQCALCHSTVDDSFAPGIGHRLDGLGQSRSQCGSDHLRWPPNLAPVETLLGVDEATLKRFLQLGDPGKFDAEVFLDGKGFQPGWKDLCRNADPARVRSCRREPAHLDRLGIGHLLERVRRQPRDARQGHLLRSAPECGGRGWNSAISHCGQSAAGNVRNDARLDHAQAGSLHLYQLAIPAPTPPRGSFDAAAQAAAKRCSTDRPSARPATCRRSSPSPAGTCTPPPRSASTTFRPSDRPINATAPRRSGGSSATRRAASTTTGAFATLGAVVDHYDTVRGLSA